MQTWTGLHIYGEEGNEETGRISCWFWWRLQREVRGRPQAKIEFSNGPLSHEKLR
jgi:hypothetical protein